MDFNNYGNDRNDRNDFSGQKNVENGSANINSDTVQEPNPNADGNMKHSINRSANGSAEHNMEQYTNTVSEQDMQQNSNPNTAQDMNRYAYGNADHGMNHSVNDRHVNMDSGRNPNVNYSSNYGPNQMGQPPYGYPYPPSYKMPGKSLATASMILGIISILSTILMTLYIPMILGSIAIVLAILSKGTKKNMPGQATTGIVCGAGGLVVNVGIFTAAMVFILSHPEILQDTARTYDTFLEQYYGESTEEMFGQSMEDMINEMFGLE